MMGDKSRKELKKMQRTTETPRGERMARIFAYLIRNRSRKFLVSDIRDYLCRNEEVSLRNVQRDLKGLSDLHDCHVRTTKERGRIYYQIEPDMRDKLSLPIERNAIMALFLLKKLQPFFAPQAKTFKEIGEAIAELSTPADYDLFEDFDEKLQTNTQVLGEQSVGALEGTMLNDLLISLIEKRRCKIKYQGTYDKEPYDTSICPVKLVMQKGELYFMCIAETKEDRDYWMKLCRIVEAKVTDRKFNITPERIARIEDRIKKSSGILSDNTPAPEKVVLSFPYYFDRICSEKRFHPTQKMRKDKKGRVLLSIDAPVDKDLVQWVLGWSDSVTVIKPEALKSRLKEMGKLLLDKYN